MNNIKFKDIHAPCNCITHYITDLNQKNLHGMLYRRYDEKCNSQIYTFIEIKKSTDKQKKQTFFTIALKINAINFMDLNFFCQHVNLNFTLQNNLISGSFTIKNFSNFKTKKKVNIFANDYITHNAKMEIVNEDLILFYVTFSETDFV